MPSTSHDCTTHWSPPSSRPRPRPHRVRNERAGRAPRPRPATGYSPPALTPSTLTPTNINSSSSSSSRADLALVVREQHLVVVERPRLVERKVVEVESDAAGLAVVKELLHDERLTCRRPGLRPADAPAVERVGARSRRASKGGVVVVVVVVAAVAEGRHLGTETRCVWVWALTGNRRCRCTRRRAVAWPAHRRCALPCR